MASTEKHSDLRATIDQWPIEDSGLSPRVVHCAQDAGVKVIGELRNWSDERLLQLRHFGMASLDNVKWFFRLTRKVEEQDFHQFPDIRSLMKQFLNKQEIFVIEQRYGLTDPLFRPNMRRQTLQAIADKLGGMTRERVRQVEEQALANLRSRLCGELRKPLELQWTREIQKRGGVITSQELGEWTQDARCGGYQPWGAMLLVSEISEAIHLHFDYFATLTPKALGRIETQIVELLRQQSGLVPFAEVQNQLRASISDPDGHLDRVLHVLLSHHPDICGTVNDEYFLPPVGTPLIIRNIFQAESKPLHFRDLTARYNERMLPNSRKGSGFVLRVLNMMPQVQRVDRAVYDLPPA